MITTLRNKEQEVYLFRIRLAIAFCFILLACGVLGARFFYLQIIQHDRYHTQAEANRISILPIVPNRGLIMDRNGTVLAHNYSAYTLEITPSKAGKLEDTLDQLSSIVEITPRDRRRFKKLMDESRNFESLPIRTKLTEEEVARFVVNRYRFPGVEVKARLFREYPFGMVASHTIGYIGRINEKDLETLEEDEKLANYRGSDHIGKIGLEESYEEELHGVTGFERVETDAGGRAVRSLSRKEPVSGNNLTLTIDIKLQEAAEKAFGERRGALVAIEPQTGEILAFVSRPGFDPNLFIDGIDQVNWDLLNNSPDKPLTNRALRGAYPPGSTIKPFMALAGLSSGKRNTGTTISDPGFFSLPGISHRYRDWKAGGHGYVDLHKSIVVSCDTYYYSLATEMGIDLINKYLTPFGFGKKTGIDVEGELSGILPSQEWKRKRFKQRWYAGDTVSVGIGQGYTLATPLQLAYATAILANNGTAIQPHLVKTITNSQTNQTQTLVFQPTHEMNFKQQHLDLVKSAMTDVVRPGGTAANVSKGAEYTIAGKTGTAQVIGMKQNEKYVESRIAERFRDHALFIAFAPVESPKLALAVLVENGGHGGSAAGPIARQIFDFYLLHKEASTPAQEIEDPDASD